MKKLFSIVMALVLVLCLSLSVFADSPSIGAATVDFGNSTYPEGANPQRDDVSSTAMAGFVAYYAANKYLGALAPIGDIYMDASPDANTWFYVTVSGLKAGDTVTVLHMNEDSDAIDVLPAANVRVFDGGFEFQPTSLSPFSYIAWRPAASTPPAATTPAAPQTGVYA